MKWPKLFPPLYAGKNSNMKQPSNKSTHWASKLHPVVAAARSTLATPKDESHEKLLSIIWRHLAPNSVVDFGCGLGLFLKTAKRMGACRVLGLDIPEVEIGSRHIQLNEFLAADFREPIQLPSRFDLAISLEVAEHLPLESASTVVESLCRASDLVLFGAAIPYQGGMGHINENWLEFWYQLFKDRGYVAFDLFRPTLWADASVTYYYKQNSILYATAASKDRLVANGLQPADTIHSYIHPDMYIKAVNRSLPSDLDTTHQDIREYYYRAAHDPKHKQQRTYGQEQLNHSQLARRLWTSPK